MVRWTRRGFDLASRNVAYLIPFVCTALGMLLLPQGALGSSAADGGPSQGDGPTAMAVQAYAEDASLPPGRAERDVHLQKQATGIVEGVEDATGNDYAGMWFDSDAGEFVVPMADSSRAPRVREAMSWVEVPSASYRTPSVRSTWTQLESAQAILNGQLKELEMAGLVQTWLDPRTNSVVIREASGLSPRQRAEISLASRRSQVAISPEPKQVDRFEIEPTECWGAILACDPPMRGGVEIDEAGEGMPGGFYTVCTAGFKATGNTTGNRYVLTAGHCYKNSADWSASGASPSYVHYLGHGDLGEYGANGDYARIQVTGYGTFWDVNPWPSEVVFWGGNQNIPITSESSSYLGESVCHSGAGTMGSNCGVVTAIDLSTPYRDGTYLAHLTEATAPAIEGDSGGPVWNGNSAVGLVSGGPPNAMLYQEVTQASEAMAVTVGPKMGTPPFTETAGVTRNANREITVTGKVDPNGYASSYFFEYGTTAQYGQSTASVSAGSGYATSPVSQAIGGVTPATSYHYRIVLVSPAGTTYGADRTVVTATASPLVRSPTRTRGSTTSEAIGFEAEPAGLASTFQIEYGTTTSYGSVFPAQPKTLAGSTGWTHGQETLTGLQPETRYHARVRVNNALGSAVSNDLIFTTLAVPPVYKSSFGSAGTGPGQFGRSIGVAVDAEGNVWTTDREDNRLQEFTPGGGFIAQFGKKGSGNGEFSNPCGIAIGANGRIWVADEGNDRVEYFSPSGSYEGQLKSNAGVAYFQEPTSIVVTQGYVYVGDYGKDAVVKVSEAGGAATVLPRTEYGLLEIHTPAGLATDAAGHLFLNSYSTDQVLLYAPQEAPIKLSWVPEVSFAGAPESTNLAGPYGLAVKPSGNFVVADKPNNRIELFSPARDLVGGGEWLASAGTSGAGGGQFNEPMGIALGPGGNIYVADAANHRIERWNQPTKPEAVTTAASAVKPTSATLGGKVDPAGLATTYRFEYGTSASYGTTAPAGGASAGSGLDRVAKTQVLTGLEPERTYHYRVVATNSEGTSYGADKTFTTVPGVTSTTSIGSQGTGPGQFGRSIGVAVDAAGNLWTTDREDNRLQKFSPSGEFIAQFGKKGSGNGEFNDPRGIAIGANGRIWVVDTGNNRVEYFSASGVYEGQWNETYVIAGQQYHLEEPTAITVTHGYVYISDYGHSAVIKRSESGGTPQLIVGSLTTPAALASDSAGDVFVSSFGTHEILEAPAGASSWQTVVNLEGLGATGILVKQSGYLLVAEKENNRLALYQPSSSGGARLATYGSAGSGSAQFAEPFGLAQGAAGSVYVADAGNHRIDRWSFE